MKNLLKWCVKNEGIQPISERTTYTSFFQLLQPFHGHHAHPLLKNGRSDIMHFFATEVTFSEPLWYVFGIQGCRIIRVKIHFVL